MPGLLPFLPVTHIQCSAAILTTPNFYVFVYLFIQSVIFTLYAPSIVLGATDTAVKVTESQIPYSPRLAMNK